MSADSQSITSNASHSVNLSAILPVAEQQSIRALLSLLSAIDIEAKQPTADDQGFTIKGFVDGRGLACPMPLLKTKVALRNVAAGESLYVVATDPNSQADITAFCRQSQQSDAANALLLALSKVTQQQPTDGKPAPRFDTIYHFIITKTDSN